MACVRELGCQTPRRPCRPVIMERWKNFIICISHNPLTSVVIRYPSISISRFCYKFILYIFSLSERQKLERLVRIPWLCMFCCVRSKGVLRCVCVLCVCIWCVIHSAESDTECRRKEVSHSLTLVFLSFWQNSYVAHSRCWPVNCHEAGRRKKLIL